MAARRIVGAELIEQARKSGRTVLEILPGDLLTPIARETAERVGIKLVDGPIPKAEHPRMDGGLSTVRALYRRSPKWIPPKKAPSPNARKFGKIALVGAGGVGLNVAQMASREDIAHEMALVDVVPGLAKATALDLNHSRGITGSSMKCEGGESFDIVDGADLVVVTAGRPRGPGMTRADLVETNRRVIHAAAAAIRDLAPDAVVIVVTNPLDEMTAEMLRATELPRERVIGMAGTLDSARFRNALAQKAGVSPGDVDAITLGSHGDEMVPVASRATIKGRPLEAFLSEEEIQECVKDAVTGGGQVVALKKTGSATIAPAHAVMELIDHIRGARTGPVPTTVMLDGEYGLENVPLGVPAFLGSGGLVSVLETGLSPSETEALESAAAAIRARLESS